MDSGKYTNGMVTFCYNTGLSYVIPFFDNIFGITAFRTIPNGTKCLKLVAVRFYDIAVINMNYWLIWSPFTNSIKIGIQCMIWSTFIQMPCKSFHAIDLFGIFVKLIYNVC